MTDTAVQGSQTVKAKRTQWLKQALAILVALLVVVAVLNKVLGSTIPEGTVSAGPSGSSFETSVDGTAAWLSLLQKSGVQTSQRRTALSVGDAVNPGEALVLIDAGRVTRKLDDVDSTAIHEFLDGGGRLISDNPELVVGLLSDTFDAGTNGDVLAVPSTLERIKIAPEADPFTTGGALELPAGDSVFDPVTLPTGAEDLFASDDGVLVAEFYPLTGGTIALLANTAFLSNQGLATLDSAAYALAIGGGRPVTFAEAHHGFAATSGVGGLPARWRWCLLFLSLATIAAMWSRGRRNGPAEPSVRELPPPRRRTVDMVAASLVRSWKANGDMPTEIKSKPADYREEVKS